MHAGRHFFKYVFHILFKFRKQVRFLICINLPFALGEIVKLFDRFDLSVMI